MCSTCSCSTAPPAQRATDAIVLLEAAGGSAPAPMYDVCTEPARTLRRYRASRGKIGQGGEAGVCPPHLMHAPPSRVLDLTTPGNASRVDRAGPELLARQSGEWSSVLVYAASETEAAPPLRRGEKTMTETVLVTGGTGYVAGWCIAELLRRGCDVRTTVRSAAKGDAVRAAVATMVDPGSRLSIATADLTSDEGWDAAVTGVDYVLHVASPLGTLNRTEPDDLIIPPRDGALPVLRAATRAGVERVVLTSAANAASPSSYAADGITDESLWTDPDDRTLIPYRRSKTLAEKAAWDYIAGYDGPTTLTTILPGAVFGPILTTSNLGSV